MPITDFSFVANKGEVTFINQSKNADKYECGFGDGIGTSQLKGVKYINYSPSDYTKSYGSRWPNSSTKSNRCQSYKTCISL